MSLPACQQRVLDGIAGSLRASEPRLAAMFAIFGRLTRNEALPLRERLTPRPALIEWLAGLSKRVIRPGARLARPGRPRAGLLAASKVAVAVVLLAVLIGTFAQVSGAHI